MTFVAQEELHSLRFRLKGSTCKPYRILVIPGRDTSKILSACSTEQKLFPRIEKETLSGKHYLTQARVLSGCFYRFLTAKTSVWFQCLAPGISQLVFHITPR